MFGSKIIRNSYGSIKDKIKSCYHSCQNFPSWYMGKIFTFINYFADVKYKVTHLKETNLNLGLVHLYNNDLNDAIFRFKLVDKFFSTSDHQANYWLGWAYFLKNNYEKALYHLKKSFEADQVNLASFLQTYNNLSEIPSAIWHQHRNFDVGGDYTKRFFGKNKVNLTYSFVSKIMSNITDLPDNYSILELGSNTGLVGDEVKKRFPDSFTFTGIENSEMVNIIALYRNIYDHVLEVSIPDFIKQNSNKYNVILSFCALSFTKNLLAYFNDIYSIVDKLGYFAFCLPINKVTNLSLKRKEFIFSITDIKEALSKTKFTILSSEELAIEKNDKYYMVVCKKNH
jgi:predicted TPR repeat methyltransferase